MVSNVPQTSPGGLKQTLTSILTFMVSALNPLRHQGSPSTNVFYKDPLNLVIKEL